MHVELLIAEIGSTTTVVNAFADLTGDAPKFLGQGMAATSIAEEASCSALRGRADLARTLGVELSSRIISLRRVRRLAAQ